jgi:plastocyanin
MKLIKKLTIYGVLCGVALFILSVPLTVGAQQPKTGEKGGTIKGKVESPWVTRYKALVYIDHVNGDFPPPKENPHMSQKGMLFQPHILPVVKGTTVDFTNDDTVAHNVFSPPGSATTFNLGIYGAGVTKTVTFNNLGEVDLLCSVHPEMDAYVMVLQNPYYALTDNQGNFEIKDVPPGTYQLKVWHEKLKEASQQVTVEAGKTTTVDFKGLTRR